MLTRLEALEMRSLWDCTKSVFDDSSSCKKANVSTQKYKPSLTETHSANMLLLRYLTEKVGQDLLCEGGCHRAELEREKSRGLFII